MHSLAYRVGRSFLIATVALTVIGWLMAPRVRPLQQRAEVSRFEDVLKRGTPVDDSEPPSKDEGSLWAQFFNRVVHAFAEPQADTFFFGSKVLKVPGHLIYQSKRGGVRAEPFLGRLSLWTKHRCRYSQRRIAAANINQFVLDRRLEIKFAPAPSDAPNDPEDKSSAVWRGPAGQPMREAIVELVRHGSLSLDDFGDMPFDEIVAVLQPIAAPADTCPKGRRT